MLPGAHESTIKGRKELTTSRAVHGCHVNVTHDSDGDAIAWSTVDVHAQLVGVVDFNHNFCRALNRRWRVTRSSCSYARRVAACSLRLLRYDVAPQQCVDILGRRCKVTKKYLYQQFFLENLRKLLVQTCER